ncbi:MAG: hypothetical protein JXR05_07275 [Flavobacteriaceae bacterium]
MAEIYKSMYYKFTEDELRAICRTHLESFEKWSRLIVHQILSEKLGQEYFFSKHQDGNYLIKKELVEKAKKMMASEPNRFPKPVDTLFLEDIIYLLCKNDFYKNYFSSFLNKMYPEGVNELRTFLSRLIPIRNMLSHSNPFSMRDAEQCVCYCNDFIECIKEYYIMTNQDKEFNIPTIIKVVDSLGNEYLIKDGRAGERLNIKDTTTNKMKTFYHGDQFSLDLTVDPSFDDTSYRLEWMPKNGMEILNNGKKINVTITDELIGNEVILWCRLITENGWHRYLKYDQQLIVHFKALPLN